MRNYEAEGGLFVIPARGGSKGIPGKNIKPLGGKPLICYSIDVARQFADDADICVSTDSEEIAEVAVSYGLPVPFLRPERLATDNASTQDALLHALDFYESQGRKFDKIVLLQPTSPFRSAEDVARCLQAWSEDIDMSVTVTEAKTNPFVNAYLIGEDGCLSPCMAGKGGGRRQDSPQVWEINGAVYVITAASLREKNMGRFERRVAVAMPRERSLDLDTLLDWEFAEFIMQKRSNG